VQRKLTGHKLSVTSLAFSRNGELLITAGSPLASSSNNNEVKLWDVAGGMEKRQLAGHMSRVFSVRFAPDDKTAISVDFDQKALVWNVETGNRQLELAGNARFAKTAAYSPDGRTIAVGSADRGEEGMFTGTIKFWDPKIGQPIASVSAHDGFINALTFNQSGDRLASGGSDGRIRIWTAELWRPAADE
jgi:tricorn protease-like protein